MQKQPSQKSTKVPIVEITERFSEIRLGDGTSLAVKPNIVEVARLEEQWDNEGNPIYIVRSQNVIMIVNTPPDLKKL